MTEVVRFDYIFSYWIFVSWILYEMKVIKYNPKILLIIGIIVNLFHLLIKIKNEKYCSTPSFIIINFIIKIIPLISVWNTEMNIKEELLFGLVLLIFYLIWLYLNNKMIILEMKFLTDKNSEMIPPFEYYFEKIFKC